MAFWRRGLAPSDFGAENSLVCRPSGVAFGGFAMHFEGCLLDGLVRASDHEAMKDFAQVQAASSVAERIRIHQKREPSSLLNSTVIGMVPN